MIGPAEKTIQGVAPFHLWFICKFNDFYSRGQERVKNDRFDIRCETGWLENLNGLPDIPGNPKKKRILGLSH